MEISETLAFQKSLSVLTALQSQNVKFKIILPDGKEYGDLDVIQDKRRTRINSTLRKRGELSNYIDPLIKHMKIGEVVQIPVPAHILDIDAKRLLSSVSSRCIGFWGNGSAMVSSNNNLIEVMKIKEASIPQLTIIETIE